MPVPTPPTRDDVHPRKPLENQKNAGGDMSMMFFARPRFPRRFASLEQHQIKGLNVETVAGILFPPPAWMTSLEYSVLRMDSENDDSNWGFFSLNLAMYNQTPVPSECDGMWFFMYGRVHPYALTWEVEPDDGLETSDDLQDYTIPALIVRDHGYQPITPRMFDIADTFPATPPIVSFTGPVVGSGRTLLHDEDVSGVGDTQRKCLWFHTALNLPCPWEPRFQWLMPGLRHLTRQCRNARSQK